MASMTVRELLTRWGFETDTKPVDRLNKSLSDMKTTVFLVGAQAAAQIGALFGLTNSVAKLGDGAAKQASRIGVNVEALQEYGHVAQLAGASTQQMNSALESLTMGIAEARKGGGKLIEPLIRINQLTGRDLLTNMGNSEDMMLRLSDAFANITDATERAELANKIFGGSGLAMVNILKQGSAAIVEQRREAQELGLVLSQGAAKQSEQFIDSMTRLKGALTGIRNIVGMELMPTINEYVDIFKDWIVTNREFLKSNIVSLLKSTVSGFKALVSFGRQAGKVLHGLMISLGGVENAVKMVMYALVTLTAVKFLSAIGNLTMAVGGGLMLAFRAAGNAALIAQAKMALIPIAIGAAIAAVLLIIEDLYAFMQGRDSLIGLLFEKFEADGFGDLITKVLDFIVGKVREYSGIIKNELLEMFTFDFSAESIANTVTSALESVAEKIREKGGMFGFLEDMLMQAIAGDNLAGKILNWWMSLVQSIGDVILIAVGGAFDTLINKIGKGAMTGVMDFFGFGGDEEEDKKMKQNMLGNLAAAGSLGSDVGPGSVTSITEGSRSTRTNITNNNSVNVPVTVPPGTSPEDGQAMVAEGVQEALARMARETHAATQTNVER